jgi:tetratricopeptide (TPR) repeat protein
VRSVVAAPLLALLLALLGACASPVEGQLEQASTLMREGSYEKALAIYEGVLKRVPDAPNIHTNMGFALSQLGRYDEAIAHFEAARAQKTPPALNATLLHNWAYALEQLGRLDDAAAKYAEAAAAVPARSGVYINWGNVLVRLGRLDEAAERYGQAVKNDPDSVVGWFNRGYALERLNRPDEALACYRTVLSLKGDLPSDLQEHARRFVAQADAAGKEEGPKL